MTGITHAIPLVNSQARNEERHREAEFDTIRCNV